MKLNVIHGNRRPERLPLLLNQLESNGITDYEIWEGIYTSSAKEGINKSHKQIVEYARIAEFPEVCICEDDLVFTCPDSWNYFLKQKPKEFDVYLSMIYSGDEIINHRVNKFTGMTLYVVAKKFYDTFLSVPDGEHIDVALSGLGDYRVCEPFVAYQRDGWSSNTGKNETYGNLLNGRKLYI